METSDSRNAKFRGNAMSSILIPLTQGVWTQITTTDKDGSIRHQSGAGQVVYTEALNQPIGLTPSTPVMESTIKGESFIYWGVTTSAFVWAYAVSDDASITVTPKGV